MGCWQALALLPWFGRNLHATMTVPLSAMSSPGEADRSKSRSAPLAVLALVEARAVSGSAKPVLVFGRLAAQASSREASLRIASFYRKGDPPEDGFTRAASEAGIPLDRIREGGRFDLSVLPQLKQLVAQTRPDVVWTNAVKSHFLVRLAGLHRKTRWLAFHHGYTATDLKMRLYNQLDRWSLRAAHRVVTVCRPFALDLESRGVAARKIRIQHMPASPILLQPDQALELRRRLGVGSGERVLLSVGRLSKEKGHADLLRVFHELQRRMEGAGLKLVIVGDGPERPRLQALADRLAIRKSVIFAGHQDDVVPFYSLAELVLLTSHSEGSPNVLLEAMSAGVPTVATSVGGIPELVRHGQEALLAEKGDIEELAAAALRLLSDAELRRGLADNARRAAARHSPEAFCRAMLQYLWEAMES